MEGCTRYAVVSLEWKMVERSAIRWIMIFLHDGCSCSLAFLLTTCIWGCKVDIVCSFCLRFQVELTKILGNGTSLSRLEIYKLRAPALIHSRLQELCLLCGLKLHRIQMWFLQKYKRVSILSSKLLYLLIRCFFVCAVLV